MRQATRYEEVGATTQPETATGRAGRDWPLTGRDRELAELRRSLTAGPPRSVVLAGRAGVGKTRLAREGQRVAERSGLTTLWVTATHSTARTPLGTFAPLLPAVPVGEAGAAAAGTVHDLLRSSAAALTERAEPGALALFVDDAHLLDDLSAGLIHQLVATGMVAAVLTVRSENPAPETVTALWKDDLADRVELPRLDRQAIEELLTAALRGQVDPAAAVDLAERSEGNVLFLRELVLGALADGNLTDDMGIWRLLGPLAPSDRIMELVAARLHGLDETCLQVLQLAAYAEPLGARELTALADPGAVRSLERQGLLVSEFDGRRVQVRLAHPLYADVVRRATSAVRVATMGRALADAAEDAGGRRREDAIRIGIWRMDGGGGSPDVLLRAAEAARWHYDFALAERLARYAADAGAGFEARLLAAQSTALRGHPAEAADQLVRLGDVVGTDRERARVAVAHIDCLWSYLGRTGEGLRVAERAEAAITDPGIRQEVSARRAGLLLAREGPGPAAAMALPRLKSDSGRSFAWLHLVAAYGLGRLGRLDEALQVADRGYEVATNLVEPGDWYPWFNLFTRCEALAQAGAYPEADALAAEQYRQGLADGSSEARAYFLWHRARTVRERGHVGPAIRDAREAITLLLRLGRLGFAHSVMSTLATALALAGDYREANRVLVAADGLDVESPQWSATDHLAARAWTAVAEGRLSAGRESLLLAAEAGRAIGDLTGAAAALHDVARLGTAARVTGELDELAEAIEGDLTRARREHVAALSAADPDALMTASQTFDRIGAGLLAAEAAADAAVVWGRADRARLAERGMHRAAALARSCSEAITPALAPIETRETLTAAERETALLAVAGRTSRQIAGELQLSVRTVDNRLQRIYQKLGISRRSDLAGLVR